MGLGKTNINIEVVTSNEQKIVCDDTLLKSDDGTAQLVSSTIVMPLVAEGNSVCHFAVRRGDTPDADWSPPTFRDSYMPKSVWEEFGSPQVITVTVKPGDLLNNGGTDG